LTGTESQEIPRKAVIQIAVEPREIPKRPVVLPGTDQEIYQPQVSKTKVKKIEILKRPVIQTSEEPQEIPKRTIVLTGTEHEVSQPPVVQTGTKTIQKHPVHVPTRPVAPTAGEPEETPECPVIHSGPEPWETFKPPSVQVGTETIGILKHPVLFPKHMVVQDTSAEPQKTPEHPVVQTAAGPEVSHQGIIRQGPSYGVSPQHPKVGSVRLSLWIGGNCKRRSCMILTCSV
jgi:hypothetical protein